METVWYDQYPSGVEKEIDLGRYNSALEVFNKAVEKFHNKPCFSNFGVTITYGELDRMSTYFAGFLQNKLGLKKGDRIAIQMPNLLQFPIAMFGALKAGLIVVNTNPLYTAREMEHQFKDSGAKAIVILANSAHHLESIVKNTDIEHVIITEIGDLLGFPKKYIINAVIKYVKKMVPSYSIPGAYSFNDALEIGKGQNFTAVDCNLDDTCFFQYTGGTTGVSKGAVLTHRNVVANMLQIFAWMEPRLKPGEEIVITPLPLYHIFSLTVNCLAMMAYGGHNILITNPRDIPAFLKEMQKWDFTILTGLNTLFNAMMNHPDFKNVSFKNCKFSVAGGMALQDAVALRWEDLTGTKILQGYGLTETSPVVSCNPIDGSDKLGTIGLPLPSTQVKLLTEEGTEGKFGEVGELLVKGPQVMKGYWNMDEETKKVITDDGWLKTGDIATIDEKGWVKIVDRKKDMILVSGFNVYPNEVEDVMIKHPAVVEVAAVGQADDASGEVVKIFVVKKGDVTEQELIGFARENLTAYKVPKFVEFKDELPKTNVGKILRRALRDGANA